MADYIEREAAIKIAENYGLSNGSTLGRHSGIADAIAAQIVNIPSSNVAPVVHGRWAKSDIPGSMLSKCTECGFSCGAHTFKYCPSCGAKMDLQAGQKEGGNNETD